MIGDDVSIIFELNNLDSYKIQGRHVITETETEHRRKDKKSGKKYYIS